MSSALRARDLALDEAVGAGLRNVDLGVLARVLDVLVPAQVCSLLVYRQRYRV